MKTKANKQLNENLFGQSKKRKHNETLVKTVLISLQDLAADFTDKFDEELDIPELETIADAIVELYTYTMKVQNKIKKIK